MQTMNDIQRLSALKLPWDAISRYLETLISAILNCGEVKYLLQPIECGDKSEIHTVREWFGDFDVSLEDTAFVHWNQAMSVISMKLKELEMQLDMMVMMSLWLTVRIALYENYSSTEEFLPQFDANVEDIIKLLDDIPKLKEMVNNGRKP